MSTEARTKTPPASLLQIALPLASLTAVGMLATDLYLPAVPMLPDHLGGTLAESQLTLASFLGALAFSQLFWGWAADRQGYDRILIIGTALMLVASVACALAGDMTFLIAGRALQGFGAGAATAVVPALLRRSFDEAQAVRAIALVGIAESFVPALGPVLGAILISVTSWRFSFWVIAVLTAVLIPLVTRVTSRLATHEPNRESFVGNLQALAKDRLFIRRSLAYAIMFGALIAFVASAPQVITQSLALPIQYFSVMQVLGVASFILLASQSGKLAEKLGAFRALKIGSGLQLASTPLFLALGFIGTSSATFVGIVVSWCLFCAGLGLRGPVTMGRALSTAGARAGQASGLLMFLSFGISSGATAAVAPFLHHGLLPLAICLSALTATSVALTLGDR